MNEATSPSLVSAETQHLLDVSEAILKGADRWAELEGLLLQRQRGAAEKHTDYIRQVEEQSVDFRVTHRETIEGLDAGFSSYGRALELMLGALAEKQTALLSEAAEQLLESGIALGPAVATFQNVRLATGPSRFEVVNFFDNLSKGFAEGKVSFETWAGACAHHVAFYESCPADLGVGSAESVGVAERREGLALAKEAIGRLEQLKPHDPRSLYDTELAKLSQAAGKMEHAQETQGAASIGPGPTDSPPANVIIYVAEQVMTKKLEPSALESVCSLYLQQIREQLVDLDNVVAAGLESDDLVDELPKAKVTLEEMSECLRSLIEFAVGHDKDMEHVDTVLGDFEEAVGRLWASNKIIKEFIDRVGKVMCPYCSGYNLATARNCEKCQRALPQRVGLEGHGAQLSSIHVLEGEGGSEEEQGPVMTEGMARLLEACDDYFKGNVTKEHALATISEFDAKIEAAERGLRPILLADPSANASAEDREVALEAQDLAGQVNEMARSGVNLCLAGLRNLRSAVEHHNQERLRDGASKYWEGVQTLFQVKHISQQVEARAENLDQAKAARPAVTAPVDHDEDAAAPEEEEVEDYPSDIG